MRCDAKVWQDGDDKWHGIHDSGCYTNKEHYDYDSLSELLIDIERCENYGNPMRWILYKYPTGMGLRGYIV